MLSKAFNSDFTGYDLEVEQTFDMAESNIGIETSHVTPQPKFMEVETHSKVECLCNRKLLVSDFERAFDALVGYGQSIVTEFVDCESSGPTYTFNELRDNLCGEAKLYFNANHICLFGLAYNYGPPEKMNWKILNPKDTPLVQTLNKR